MVMLIISICIIGVFVLPYWLIPTRPFSQPSGQWQVGVSDLIWDTPSQSGIIAKVWYPTNRDRVIYSPYIGKIGGKLSTNPVINLAFKLIFSHLLLGHANVPASIDAALSQSQANFPVIIFSSGLGINILNTFHALEFASHGFIVVGINHPGLSTSTMLVDGSQIGIEQEIVDGLHQPDLLVSKIAVNQANQISMAIDRVIEMNSMNDSFLDRKIDTDRIFAIGHSIGGSASFVACGKDRRISKAIDLDGYFYMDEIDLSCTEKDFLLVLSNREKYTIDDGKSQATHQAMMAKDKIRIHQLADNANFKTLKLDSASHFSFLDLPLMVNPKLRKTIGLVGDTDPLVILSKTSRIAIDFFDR